MLEPDGNNENLPAGRAEQRARDAVDFTKNSAMHEDGIERQDLPAKVFDQSVNVFPVYPARAR